MSFRGAAAAVKKGRKRMTTKTDKSHIAPPETCGKCGKVIAGAEAAFMLDGQIACGACVVTASKTVQKEAWLAEVKPPDYRWLKLYGGILSGMGFFFTLLGAIGLILSCVLWGAGHALWAWNFLMAGIPMLVGGIALAAAGQLILAIRDGVRNTFYLWPH